MYSKASTLPDQQIARIDLTEDGKALEYMQQNQLGNIPVSRADLPYEKHLSILAHISCLATGAKQDLTTDLLRVRSLIGLIHTALHKEFTKCTTEEELTALLNEKLPQQKDLPLELNRDDLIQFYVKWKTWEPLELTDDEIKGIIEIADTPPETTDLTKENKALLKSFELTRQGTTPHRKEKDKPLNQLQTNKDLLKMLSAIYPIQKSMLDKNMIPNLTPPPIKALEKIYLYHKKSQKILDFATQYRSAIRDPDPIAMFNREVVTAPPREYESKQRVSQF